eukprot:maker-scaffold159_size295958-snap-gene-1.38 protein:Tk05092 transcript:maker-scaffold159_size295958-snap-gene-1.38-mRNA-1 annotation:"conserved hypothetical protein"
MTIETELHPTTSVNHTPFGKSHDDLFHTNNYPRLTPDSTVGGSNPNDTDSDKMTTPPPPHYPEKDLRPISPLRRNGSFAHAMARPSRAANGGPRLNGYVPPTPAKVYREGNDPQFEGEVSRCRLGVEWAISIFMDCVLLFTELLFNLWLALLMRGQGHFGPHVAIIILFFVPSAINALVWLNIKKSYPQIGVPFMLAVVTCGFPSPLFVYIWHLYLTAFCSQPESQRSKILANVFRLVQALSCSIPLLLLNLYTLISILHAEESQSLNLTTLGDHLSLDINLKIHSLAAIVSFMNIMRAGSVFNERKTYTILFVMAGYPFLLFTIVSRILSMAVIISFMTMQWILCLFFGLFLTNLLLYRLCRKPTLSSTPTEETQLDPLEGSSDQLSASDLPCCSSAGPCSNDLDKKEDGFWPNFPKIVALSLCSIFIPAAYTNDLRSHHPRLRGGLYIVLNYFFNMLWIGLALGFAIVYHVPNTIQGVTLPQPSFKVEVPGSKVIVQAGGLDVAVNLPVQKLDLGSMPAVSATLNTDSTDVLHAIIFPLILAVLAVPFVIMRAAMMELDCFVTRKKELDVPQEQHDECDGGRVEVYVDAGGRSHKIRPLHKAIVENAEDRRLKARLYVTICCSVCGMCVFTVMMGVTGALLVLQFH